MILEISLYRGFCRIYMDRSLDLLNHRQIIIIMIEQYMKNSIKYYHSMIISLVLSLPKLSFNDHAFFIWSTDGKALIYSRTHINLCRKKLA